MYVRMWPVVYASPTLPTFESDRPPQGKYAFCVLYNLVTAQFALAKDSVDKRDWDFSNSVAQGASPYDDFHLENVALGRASRDDIAKDRQAVQSKESAETKMKPACGGGRH